MTTPRALLAAFFIASSSMGVICQAAKSPAGGNMLPRFIEKDGRHAFIVDGAPFLMLGGQCGNSSAWPETMPGVWSAIERMHANTLEIPIYWEQFEPERGTYDTKWVDTLVRDAHDRHIRLVLLWFGTWKNGSAHYIPLWMKADPSLCPKIIGKSGLRVDSPSPHSRDTLEADSRAFAALMRHLKAADPTHTVIMVQVENEAGAWNSIRDYSPQAQVLFDRAVPAALLDALGLSAKAGGSWHAVFGPDADEFFHAWSVASYVGHVAAAGKAEYPLPMYANAALRDPIAPGPAGTYESGGPTDNVLAIWKAAAPALDVLAPDIYLQDGPRYRRVLELYSRPDNPLFVPETGGSPWYARMFFTALGYGAVGWAPFGIDRGGDGSPSTDRSPGEDPLAPIAVNYRIVGPIMREIARLNFEGRLQTVVEDKDAHAQTMTFGAWKAVVTFGAPRFGFGTEPTGNPDLSGRALVASLGENEFLVAGHSCRVDFHPSDAGPKAQREYLHVEEGGYEDGIFKPARIWNGDQTDWGLNFGSKAVVLRVRLGRF